MHRRRILYSVALVASVLFLPWWMSFIFMTLGVFLFNNFFEVMFIGIFFDALYAAPGIFPEGAVFVCTLFAVAIFFVGNMLKKYTRFN